MSKHPSPRLDQLRAMREAEWNRALGGTRKFEAISTAKLDHAMKEAKGGTIGRKKRRGKK